MTGFTHASNWSPNYSMLLLLTIMHTTRRVRLRHEKIASDIRKFPKYITNSLGFPELTNSLRFLRFPEL